MNPNPPHPSEVHVYYLLGIDDTDSPASGDTAALAYLLGCHLETRSLARLINISCHQLLQHPGIAHTSQNIACCLLLDSDELKLREIDMACREILHRKSAPTANPGYTLASWSQFNNEVIEWGRNAKILPLDRSAGITLARCCGYSAAGISGSGTGVIGALAAVGLRYDGSDGWISWMPGLPGLKGIYTQMQLTQIIRFDLIETEQHRRPALDARILISESTRPLLQDGKILLSISASKRGADYEWQT